MNHIHADNFQTQMKSKHPFEGPGHEVLGNRLELKIPFWKICLFIQRVAESTLPAW